MSSLELKPCPFCGEAAVFYYVHNKGTYVQCERCFARTGCFHDAPADAAAEWNTRVGDISAKMSAEAEATDGEAKRP